MSHALAPVAQSATRITLDDAIDALACGNYDTVSSFLQRLASMAAMELPTEAHGFALDAACQSGFDIIDDDAEIFVVSGKDLAAFIVKVDAVVRGKP